MKITSTAFVVTLVLASAAGATEFAGEALLGNGSAQHVLVIVEKQGDSTGRLYRYALDNLQWQQVGHSVAVSVGVNGVGKAREGDQRAPTGAYPLTAAFGYATLPPSWLKMPYMPLREETECVSDANSGHYNQVVNPSELPAGRSWSHSEMMHRKTFNGDNLYKYGVVVGYNPTGARDAASGGGAGSCIFLHIWRGPGEPTAGCTALSEPAMIDLLKWLDPKASPLLVQGTRADLLALRGRGSLPYPIPAP